MLNISGLGMHIDKMAGCTTYFKVYSYIKVYPYKRHTALWIWHVEYIRAKYKLRDFLTGDIESHETHKIYDLLKL